MKRLPVRLIAGILILSFLLLPSCAQAGQTTGQQEMETGKMLADALFVRPLGLVATILGTAVFIVSLPFSLLGGNSGTAAKKLVAEPAAYTFKRPLGDL